MSHTLTNRAKNEIMQLIYTEWKRPLRPLAVFQERELDFFNSYLNTYQGWVCHVSYVTGTIEVWLVVDISGGLSDDDWHLEFLWVE